MSLHIVQSDKRETVTIKKLPNYPEDVEVTLLKSLPTGEKRAILNKHPQRGESEDKGMDAALDVLVSLIKDWSFGEEIEIKEEGKAPEKKVQKMAINLESLNKLDENAVGVLLLYGSGNLEVEKDGSWNVINEEKKRANTQ